MRTQEIIDNSRTYLGDDTSEEYTDEKMLVFANDTFRDLSVRSKCISEPYYIPKIKGQGYYGLPPGTSSIRLVMFKYPSGYFPLTLGNLSLNQILANECYDGSYPTEYTFWGKSRIEKVIATEVLYAQSQTREVPEAYIGISAVNFELRKGDKVINVSDGLSEGELIRSEPETITRIYYTTLQGGTRPFFRDGDYVRITSPHVHNQTLLIAPTPFETDDSGEESIAVYLTRRHRVITKENIDSYNDFIELDDELITAAQWGICYFGSVAIRGVENPSTASFKVLYDEAYYKALPKINDRLDSTITHWKRSVEQLPVGGVRIVSEPRNPINALRQIDVR